jgi:hypothetical protein
MIPLANAQVTSQSQSPSGWTSLASTFTDTTNDVLRYTPAGGPSEGTYGDFHDEIDIVNISLVDSMLLSGYLELFVEFVVVPLDNSSYVFTIYIDSNNDNSGDYFVQLAAGGFAFKRLSDNYYFNFGGEIWSSTYTTIPFSDYGTGFIISKMNISISNIQTSQVAVVAACSFGVYLYADFTPLNYTAPSGIPGFSFQIVLLSFITILGLLWILDRKKASIVQK